VPHHAWYDVFHIHRSWILLCLCSAPCVLLAPAFSRVVLLLRVPRVPFSVDTPYLTLSSAQRLYHPPVRRHVETSRSSTSCEVASQRAVRGSEPPFATTLVCALRGTSLSRCNVVTVAPRYRLAPRGVWCVCTWYNWLMHLDLILIRAGWSPSETQHDHSLSQNAYPYRDRRCWPWQHLRLQGFGL
jgi:hypothetical protein